MADSVLVPPGFERPSAIQQRAIKPIIKGRDVIAQFVMLSLFALVMLSCLAAPSSSSSSFRGSMASSFFSSSSSSSWYLSGRCDVIVLTPFSPAQGSVRHGQDGHLLNLSLATHRHNRPVGFCLNIFFPWTALSHSSSFPSFPLSFFIFPFFHSCSLFRSVFPRFFSFSFFFFFFLFFFSFLWRAARRRC